MLSHLSSLLLRSFHVLLSHFVFHVQWDKCFFLPSTWCQGLLLSYRSKKAGKSTTREWEPPQWWVEVSWLFPKLAILDNNNEKQAYSLVALTTSSPLWHNPYHTCLLSMLSHFCHKHWNQFSFCFSSSIASSFHSCFLPITEFSEKDNDLDRLSITLSLRYFS